MTDLFRGGLTPRALEMRRIVEEQRASGMTVAEFAMRRGISASTIFHWRHRFRAATRRAEPAFVPVVVVDDPPAVATGERDSQGTAATFVLELAGSRKVTVPSGFAADDLRRLLEVLESC